MFSQIPQMDAENFTCDNQRNRREVNYWFSEEPPAFAGGSFLFYHEERLKEKHSLW